MTTETGNSQAVFLDPACGTLSSSTNIENLKKLRNFGSQCSAQVTYWREAQEMDAAWGIGQSRVLLVPLPAITLAHPRLQHGVFPYPAADPLGPTKSRFTGSPAHQHNQHHCQDCATTALQKQRGGSCVAVMNTFLIHPFKILNEPIGNSSTTIMAGFDPSDIFLLQPVSSAICPKYI